MSGKGIKNKVEHLRDRSKSKILSLGLLTEKIKIKSDVLTAQSKGIIEKVFSFLLGLRVE